MKVYNVTEQWCNYDGWPIAHRVVMGTFDSEEKARQFIFEQTAQKTALEYGWANVEKNGSSHRWHIQPLDVK